jgi:predicted RNase H-like HicB family nuclease
LAVRDPNGRFPSRRYGSIIDGRFRPLDWPSLYERQPPHHLGRRRVRGARPRPARREVAHLVAQHLTDLSADLAGVGEREDGIPLPHGDLATSMLRASIAAKSARSSPASFGVSFPDCQAVFPQATRLRKRSANAAVALAGHLAVMEADGGAIPKARSLE